MRWRIGGNIVSDRPRPKCGRQHGKSEAWDEAVTMLEEDFADVRFDGHLTT
jgi:hypothetical protein